MNNNSLQVFTFNDKLPVRIIDIGGNPWFCAKDVCKCLEISRTNDATNGLDDDEKGTAKIRTPGGMQDMTVISESGLYTLLMRSNKEQAKTFRRWVTHEVLPAIRKTGKYENPDAIQDISPVVTQQPHEVPNLRYASRGIMNSARKIISEALHCESEKDFQTVIALDKIFKQSYGVSALDLAGIRLAVRDKSSVSIDKYSCASGPLYVRTTQFFFEWEHSLPTLPPTEEHCFPITVSTDVQF